MSDEVAAIADFVRSNRGPLASFIRRRAHATGSRPAADRPGKADIEALEAEAAGVLLDLACALLCRLQPGRTWRAEELLPHMPEDLRRGIHLPRSGAYHAVLAEFQARHDA